MTYFNIAIVRIIGNELPPRHEVGSSLKQLDFIHRHEPSNEQVKKIWVLNRIVDQSLQGALEERLKLYGYEYTVLPFDREAYELFVRSQNLAMRVLRPKFYVRKLAGQIIHINAARNVALAMGKLHADWIVSLDGGCSLTQSALYDIMNKISSEQRDVFAIPTYRMAHFADWHHDRILKQPMHEPMLLLRSSYQSIFDETRDYGNHDKLHTIQQLFPASIIKQTSYATIIDHPAYTAGYNLRLPSGNVFAESKHSIRRGLRNKGLARLVRHVNELA